MKKVISFISVFVACFAFLFVITSCGNSNSNTDNDKQETVAPVNPESSGETKPSNPDVSSETEPSNPDVPVNPGTDEDVYYIITFKDYDGTVLQTSSVKNGDTPSYNKSNPTRDNDDNYSYIFSGWQPTLTKVSEDAVYTATYTSQSLPYNVTINLDGGTSTQSKLQFKTDNVSKDLLPFDVKKSGYAFKGYELNNVKVYDENGNAVNNYQPSANMTFKAIYEEAVMLTIYYTIYNPKTGELIETFNTKPTDLGKVSETRNYSFNTYVDLFADTNEGYTFVGWYNEGQVLSNEKDYKYMIWNEDFTIEARFKRTLYDLNVWSNNTDLGQVMIRNGNSQTFYNEETLNEYYKESVTLVAYSKTDTRFLGWYDEKNELVSPNAVYTFNMLNRDYKLEAKWNYFNVTYDLDGGTNNINNPTSYNADMQNITLLNPKRDGYTFQGWEYKGNIITSVNTSNICHMELKALWIYYTLTTNVNNSKAGSVSSYSNTKISKDKTVTITASTNPGYTFIGWYDGESELTKELSYTFTMPAENLILEARYSINKYTITIDNKAEGVTISGITSGNEYEYDSQIALTATNIPSGYTIRWERSDGVIFVGDTCAFKMLSENITITTTTRPYTREENKIYFGTYPQTLVSDDTIISVLNTKVGDLPTDTDTKAWTDYNYYISSSIASFMFYQDIDYDNNGTYDYRGVYFIQYRPYDYSSSSSTSYTYQDDNGYSTNTIYWFSYDPIEWDILSESNGKALIIANLILDSQDYYPSNSLSSFSHNGGTGYASNYELSNIRKFLNDNFYNTAFNDLQKSLIKTTTVNNSVSSTACSTSDYACNDTNDKLFLLSYKELTTYYTSRESKLAKGSDYAKSQGLYFNASSGNYQGYSKWWLRSPDDDAIFAQYVTVSGITEDVGSSGKIFYYDEFVFRNDYGIRPACWITL